MAASSENLGALLHGEKGSKGKIWFDDLKEKLKVIEHNYILHTLLNLEIKVIFQSKKEGGKSFYNFALKEVFYTFRK